MSCFAKIYLTTFMKNLAFSFIFFSASVNCKLLFDLDSVDGDKLISHNLSGKEGGASAYRQEEALVFPLEATHYGTKRFYHNFSFTSTNCAVLNYDVFFPSDFDWSKGGKINGLGSLNPPSGGNNGSNEGWSARVLFESFGYISLYIYSPQGNGSWGDSYKSYKPVLIPGEWINIDFRAKINHTGYARFILYVDYYPAIYLESVKLFSEKSEFSKISSFMLSVFFGGNDKTYSPKSYFGYRQDTVISFRSLFVKKC